MTDAPEVLLTDSDLEEARRAVLGLAGRQRADPARGRGAQKAAADLSARRKASGWQPLTLCRRSSRATLRLCRQGPRGRGGGGVPLEGCSDTTGVTNMSTTKMQVRPRALRAPQGRARRNDREGKGHRRARKAADRNLTATEEAACQKALNRIAESIPNSRPRAMPRSPRSSHWAATTRAATTRTAASRLPRLPGSGGQERDGPQGGNALAPEGIQ